jgi:dihydroxy-acid dehydratase
MTGCDKTTPSTLMGACSVDLPTIVVPGGPMLNGRFRGGTIGSGSFNWVIKEKQKKDKFNEEDMLEAEICAARSIGHCNTMGTASTMATMVEALGLTLPGMSSIPAADSRKKVLTQLSGRRIVEMVRENMTLSKVLKCNCCKCRYRRFNQFIDSLNRHRRKNRREVGIGRLR